MTLLERPERVRANVQRRIFRAGVVFLALLGYCVPASPADAPGKATIFRDTWGVPHVYGDTPEAAMYAHGYAQAEDRLDDILAVYTVAQGKAAKVFGKSGIKQDYETWIARHPDVARSGYPRLTQEARRLIEYFLAGIWAYIHEHPEDVPDWADTPKPYHVLALYRAFIWDWPWGQALGDLKRAGSHVRDGRGSNQWVVGPSRSAEGGPIALIDPHLGWTPQNRFYESHVHGGDLNFYGFSIVGTPIMALGHTDVLSLAATTGGPDCADIYEEKINPENSLQYAYDGDWRSIEVDEVEIEVRTPEGPTFETIKIERTHHGPILKRIGLQAYVVKTAYDDEIDTIDQWIGMIKARNLGEFLNAMAVNQSLPQNIMYADIYGNTYYIRAGRVPIRPSGFHWDAPVPGFTSRSEWQGIHPLQDLVQILNPPSGAMQNCNVSPGAMMPSSPLTEDRYPGYIYNTRTDRANSRGLRALQLLGDTGQMTLEQATEIALDTFVYGAERWQAALAEAYKAHRTPFAHLNLAIELLTNWNGRMDVESPAAALFRYWMRSCLQENSGVPRSRIEQGKTLAGGAYNAMLKALSEAVREMEAELGRIDVPWGDVYRAGRDDRTWPVGGCTADGISTLRAVNSSQPDDNGISHVTGGQFCTTIVLLREGNVISYSATPYGQSNHPDSPHYTDQGEKLFSKGRFKPTWYQKADLLKHVKSRKTFAVPVLDGFKNNWKN